MKTLHEHVIIYDDKCPLCDLYTGVFVKASFLDSNGREGFSNLPDSIGNLIDKKRACDEIALVDRNTGETVYGIDSLCKILGHRWPTLNFIFNMVALRWIAKKIYFFISYNRKVIAPGKIFEDGKACVPSFSLSYRWLYIGVVWCLIICGGQVIFQSVVIFFIRRDRLLHYLGNMMTISLGGALLLYR